MDFRQVKAVDLFSGRLSSPVPLIGWISVDAFPQNRRRILHSSKPFLKPCACTEAANSERPRH